MNRVEASVDPVLSEASLTSYADPSDPTGVVLMLHGGKDRSRQPVDGRSASWRRSAAMARAIAPDAAQAGAAVRLLRYRERGWNGGTGPVADARTALARLREELGELPIVLLGHSMGSRTAVHVADDPLVRGVVALAPWFTAAEPVAGLVGKTLVAAHGRTDKITSARATRAYVEHARTAGVDATFLDMGRVGHYMFRRVADWNRVALDRSLAVLG